MTSLFQSLFSKKKKVTVPKKLNAATATKVLKFLAHGLTFGAESLGKHYPPESKVNEFVAVSGAILKGLMPTATDLPLADSIIISVHVNDYSKQIKFMQIGDHVMLVLDGCEHIITLATLSQIYSSLRQDILNHAEIYGEHLRMIASSCPASR